MPKIGPICSKFLNDHAVPSDGMSDRLTEWWTDQVMGWVEWSGTALEAWVHVPSPFGCPDKNVPLCMLSMLPIKAVPCFFFACMHIIYNVGYIQLCVSTQYVNRPCLVGYVLVMTNIGNAGLTVGHMPSWCCCSLSPVPYQPSRPTVCQTKVLDLGRLEVRY